MSCTFLPVFTSKNTQSESTIEPILVDYQKTTTNIKRPRYQLRSKGGLTEDYLVAHTDDVRPTTYRANGHLDRCFYHREQLNFADDALLPLSENVYLNTLDNNEFHSYVVYVKESTQRGRKKLFATHLDNFPTRFGKDASQSEKSPGTNRRIKIS